MPEKISNFPSKEKAENLPNPSEILALFKQEEVEVSLDYLEKNLSRLEKVIDEINSAQEQSQNEDDRWKWDDQLSAFSDELRGFYDVARQIHDDVCERIRVMSEQGLSSSDIKVYEDFRDRVSSLLK